MAIGKNVKKYLLSIFAVLLFLFACGIIQYFIWSDLFIQEFDADVAENVIWAQAAVESGKLINPDFFYTHLLPFGGQLVFIPIVRHFGVTLYALRLGMSICSMLFALALAVFFLSMHWGVAKSFFSSAIILLFLSGTSRLRDIFWSHVVHYNLSLFYLLLSMIFLSLSFQEKRKIRTAGLIGFEVCLILGSANDIAVLLFFSLALFCGILMERFFMDNGFKGFFRKDNLKLFAETSVGILAGFLLGKLLTINSSTAYAEMFSQFSPAGQWMENLLAFPNNWLTMFTILPEEKIPFFSSVGIKLLVRLAAALLLPLIFIRSFFVFRRLKSRSERIFLCITWFITAATLFFYIFGVISTTSWRIIPMFFTVLITSLIILRQDLADLPDKAPAIQLLESGTAVSMLLYALICSVTVFHQSISTDLWFGQGTILKTLADHSLTYGYNLDYWFANSITVLTDERIRVREVILRNDDYLTPSYHQSNIHWYEDQPDVDRYFLICQEDEFWRHPEFAEGAIETYRATQERTFYPGTAGFFIFVYENNIFPTAGEKN
ncbi:MAG: hypothetical protein IJI14_13005 [Anaerolineaceae bacterium]|nr:hypothetical protein [Anaerolineaceae bacterium]